MRSKRMRSKRIRSKRIKQRGGGITPDQARLILAEIPSYSKEHKMHVINTINTMEPIDFDNLLEEIKKRKGDAIKLLKYLRTKSIVSTGNNERFVDFADTDEED
jgi:hypothetical protein